MGIAIHYQEGLNSVDHVGRIFHASEEVRHGQG